MYRLADALEQRLQYESEHQFYLCEACSLRFEFEEAMEFGFECPECGTQLEAMENTRMVEATEARLAELQEELNIEPEAEA
mgnify:FL=1